jgi:hypothetical protein
MGQAPLVLSKLRFGIFDESQRGGRGHLGHGEPAMVERPREGSPQAPRGRNQVKLGPDVVPTGLKHYCSPGDSQVWLAVGLMTPPLRGSPTGAREKDVH